TISPRCSAFRDAKGARRARATPSWAEKNRAGPTTLLPRRNPTQRYAYASNFVLPIETAAAFTPACSSHDLDRAADNAGIGLRLDLASRTLSDLAWLVIKVKRDGAM